MSDVAPILLALGVVLLIVTVAGHGMWVFLAALFREFKRPSDQPVRKCVFCRNEVSSRATRCTWCGRSLTDAFAREMMDLEAVDRQLAQFKNAGILDPEAFEKLADYVHRRLRMPVDVKNKASKPAAEQASQVVVQAAQIVVQASRLPDAAGTAAPKDQEVVLGQRPPATPVAANPSEAGPEVVVAQTVESVSGVAPTEVRTPVESLESRRQATSPPPRAAQPAVVAAAKSPEPPQPPQKTWTDTLAAFMEDRNIRWAELIGVLVGGLLIVGSSIALVMSFWDTLRGTYLKFLVFVGYSSVVFGVGLFAYHRWRLLATGRGLLTIASLLVPLNFVLMASLSPAAWGWQTAATETISLVIFTGLTALAAGVLVGNRRWPLVLAMVGNSIVILLAARLLDQRVTDVVLLCTNIAPVALFALAIFGDQTGLPRHRLDRSDAASRFTLIGLSAFATIVAMGILVARGSSALGMRVALDCLAPPLAIAAWPVLAAGLRVMHGLARGSDQAAYRTGGTLVALLGVALQLVALGLSWPQPAELIAIGLVNAAVLVFVAVRYRFPIAHAGAMASLALAYLVGIHLATHDALWALQRESLLIRADELGSIVLHTILSARSATSLCGLFLVFAGIAAWLAKLGKSRHAVAYAFGCGVTAAVAIVAVTAIAFHGDRSNALQAGAIYAFYGVACLLIATRWQRTLFSYVGWNLLAVAPFWTLTFPLFATWQHTLALAGCLFWLSTVWFFLAWRFKNIALIRAQQWVLAAAGVMAATAWLQTQPWVDSLPRDLWDPRSLQTYGIALAFLSLAWVAARITLRGNATACWLLKIERQHTDNDAKQPPTDAAMGIVIPHSSVDEPMGDWWMRHLVIWFQTALAVFYVLPGIRHELGVRWYWETALGPFQHASGPLAWLLLGLLAILLIAAMWERWRSAELLGVLLLAATAPCLLAGQFADAVAVGSALRWGLGISFVICSAGVWQRERLAQWARSMQTYIAIDRHGPRIARVACLALTAGPVLGLTFLAAGLQLSSITPDGPLADTLFYRLGPNVSYLVPLVLVIVGLVGHALREWWEGYAFSAGLVADAAVALGYALHIVTGADSPHAFGTEQWIMLGQLTTIMAGAWSLAWLAARKLLYQEPVLRLDKCPCLTMQMVLPILGNAILLLLPTLRLVARPESMPEWAGMIAGVGGCLAFLLAVAGSTWYLRLVDPRSLPHVLGGALLGAGVLLVCGLSRCPDLADVVGLEYDVLMLAWAVAGLVMLAVGVFARRLWQASPTILCGWATGFGVLAVGLAMLYAPWNDASAWCSIAAISLVSVTMAVVAFWRRWPAYVFLSGLLFNAIGVVGWLAWGNRASPSEFVYVQTLCLAAASTVWTLLHWLMPRGVPHTTFAKRPVMFAHLALDVGLVAMAIVAFGGLFRSLEYVPVVVTRFGWTALAGLAAAIALTLWDRHARRTLLGLYAAGCIAMLMRWQAVSLDWETLVNLAASELAAFVLATALLGWLLCKPQAICRWLRIPATEDRWPTSWFLASQTILSAIVAVTSVGASIDFRFDDFEGPIGWCRNFGRLTGVCGAVMLWAAAVLMAWCAKRLATAASSEIPAIRQEKGAWQSVWQYAALAAGLLCLGCGGWAWLSPASSRIAENPWLHRSVVLLGASAIMAIFATVVLPKALLPMCEDWLATARRIGTHFGSLAVACLVLVLFLEGCLFGSAIGCVMASWAIAVVAAALLSMIIACIVLAVSPRPDPFGWTGRSRQRYVYAAEVLLALAGLHLRVTLPWLFHLGIIERYWMFLVMAVAFVGAGLSEFFQRRRLPVLSEPLERTALGVPLLPAIGFWVTPESSSLLGLVGRTPMLWLLVGTFYGTMAYLRRSLGCAVLAVIAANIGFWVGLHQSGIGFLHHPQLWLIPIALAALVAEHLNHKRLSATQSATIHYLALSVIYLSSTADMFIAGLGKDWRLPIVLMLLSVAGVFAGVLLRIRSFLLLGIVFLLLDIVSMIWYAAVDLEQTWIWYASGIVLGAAIIAAFALFEKRRNDLLTAVEKLKQWKR